MVGRRAHEQPVAQVESAGACSPLALAACTALAALSHKWCAPVLASPRQMACASTRSPLMQAAWLALTVPLAQNYPSSPLSPPPPAPDRQPGKVGEHWSRIVLCSWSASLRDILSYFVLHLTCPWCLYLFWEIFRWNMVYIQNGNPKMLGQWSLLGWSNMELENWETDFLIWQCSQSDKALCQLNERTLPDNL